MKTKKQVLRLVIFSLLLIFLGCSDDGILMSELNPDIAEKGGKPDKTGDTEAGNNLSFPVIWADSDGITDADSDGIVDGQKELRGTMGAVTLEGTWWYVWGEDPIDPGDAEENGIDSCGPYLLDENGEYIYGGDGEECTESEMDYKAYIQKDAANVWQASNWVPDNLVVVDEIDWGDSLESIDWSINSQVRTEVTLYKNLIGYDDLPEDPVIQYAMRHCDSWGIDEVHGLQTNKDDVPITGLEGQGEKATVFTPNARLTIQKLYVENLDDIGTQLTWDIADKKWTGAVINETPLLSNAVYEAEDGPGSFSAEVNVKGKIMFGYTWNVRKLNEDPGYYRITFSLDEESNLNTSFEDEVTEILYPIEEGEDSTVLAEVESESAPKGGHAELDITEDYQLTYMDILIVSKTTGTGGGGGNGGQGGGSGGGSGSGHH